MTRIVNVPLDDIALEGELVVPDGAVGLVVFAHGSGSSRLSPRNTFVAEQLQGNGLATFLFDLLTEQEDARYEPGASHLFEEAGALEEVAGRAGEWFSRHLV
jgi:fermentation-respiration switch protein FrsA (DUF1100 family)